jgi:hypothetical protein
MNRRDEQISIYGIDIVSKHNPICPFRVTAISATLLAERAAYSD